MDEAKSNTARTPRGGGDGKPAPRTVAELAAAKQLPAKFLLAEGLHDLPGGGIGIPYHSEDGEKLFERSRGVPGVKTRFHQPKGVKLVPYGLHRLADRTNDASLYLAEGETDTLTLWHHGLHALGLPGSNTAGALGLEHLSGVETIYACPDNDQGGETFVAGVLERLQQLQYTGITYKVILPDRIKDVNDLHCLGEKSFRKDLARLVRDAVPLRIPSATAPGPAEPGQIGVRLTDCDSLRMRPTRFVVPDFIPRGGLTIIAGDGGDGKSAITLHLTAKVSRGQCCFGIPYPDPVRGQVILIGCEDAADTTVLPRLAAAGADLSQVKLLDATINDKGAEVPFTLADVGALDATLERMPDVALIVIDPVSAFIPGRVDDHKDSEVRGLLRPLADLAARRDIAVVLVKHLNKSDSGNSGNLVAGSRAYVNAARAAFIVGRDPTDDTDSGRCVMVFSKRNLTPRDKGLAYSKKQLTADEQNKVLALQQAQHLTSEEKEALRGQLFRVEWIGETNVTDRDLAKARRGTAEPGSQSTKKEARIGEAADWLRGYLGSERKLSETVLDAGKQAGFSRNILFEAKKEAGIQASNAGRARGQWVWFIPDPPADEPAETGTSASDDPFPD